jgi:hypothetical protein
MIKYDKNCLIFLLLLMLNGCTSPLEMKDPKENDFDGYRWTFLGLEGKSVRAVEDTPWGLFAGTVEHGVFRYDKGQKSWISLGLNHAIISEIAYVATDEPKILVGVTCCRIDQIQSTPAAIFATMDRGDTWLEWDGGLAQQNVDSFWAKSILVDKKKHERIYFGEDTFQLLYSEDAGKTWEYISGGPGQGGGATFTITLSPKRDGRIWFGGYEAFAYPIIYRSDDWGRDAEVVYWERFESAVRKIIVDDWNADQLWMIRGGGIYESSNGGDEWDVIFAPALIDPDEQVEFTGLVKENITLYAVAAKYPETHSGEFELGFYKRSTSDSSWKALSQPQNVRVPWDLKLDRQNRLLIPTSNGLWRVEIQ